MTFRWTLLLAFLLVAAAQGVMIWTGVTPLLDGRLVDGDCYFRLARVEALLGGQGWYDATFSLLNAPYGGTLHWTRPLDLLIALLSLPLWPVLGLKQAVWMAGLSVSPLLQFVGVAALLWGLGPYLRPPTQLLAVVLFLVQPGLAWTYLAARPDHHGLLQTLMMIVLAGLMRPGPRSAAVAGISTGLALWVSAESLLFVFLGGLALGLDWLGGGEGTKKRLITFLAFLALSASLGLGVERPPLDWLTVEYDRLSIVQVGFCWFLLLAGLGLAAGNAWAVDWRRRLLLGAVMAALAAGLTALFFPQFFAGPYAVVIDPRLHDIWFAHIKEEMPLVFGPKAVLFLTPPILGLTYALWRLTSQTQPEERLVLLVSLAALAVTIPATVYLVRFAGFSQMAAVVPWTLLVLSVMRQRKLRILAVPLLLTGHFLLTGLAAKSSLGAKVSELPKVCAWQHLAERLKSEWPNDHRPVLTYIFPGPELGYLSGHPIVAGPYHRSVDGILDIVNALGASDDAPARELVQRRNLGLIAVCDEEAEGLDFEEATGSNGFHARLARGESPDWLKLSLVLKDPKGTFRVYEVRD